MHTYIHTYIHIYIHTKKTPPRHTYIHTHTNIHTYIQRIYKITWMLFKNIFQMRIALFLIVLLALNVYSADAWGIRRVFRSIRRAIRRVVSPIVRIVRPIVRLVKPLAKEAAICYAKDYALGKVWSYGKTLLGKRGNILVWNWLNERQ